MRKIRSPAAAHIEMFAIEIQVWAKGRLAMIRILTDNNDSPRVARESHCLDNGVRRAGSLNRHISAAAACVLTHPFTSLFFIVSFKVKRRRGTGFQSRFQAMLWSPDTK